MENKKQLEKNKRRPRRTRFMIRKDIFDAVGNIIKNEGFSNLSINSIAEYAEMESIVVYRNFNNLDTIIEQYIERFDFWLSFFSKDDGKNIDATKQYYQSSLSELFDMVHKKKEIQQMIIWELTDDSRFTKDIAERIESGAESFISRYTSLFKDSNLNIRVITAIFVAAIYYLSISKEQTSFCGINLKGKDGREILNEGLDGIINLVFERQSKIKEKEIARRILGEGVPIEIVIKATGLTKEEILGNIG